MKKRVLIIPDAYWGLDSGAVAARNAANVWLDIGCEVGVYATGKPQPGVVNDKILVFDRPPYRGTNHLFGGDRLAAFEKLLDSYRPSHVFFLGSAISKPTPFFCACRRRGIRTIGFWWIQDFFCSNGYACLPNGPCQLCIDGNYLHSFLNRCSYREDFNPVRSLVHAVSLRKLKKELLSCDIMMGSSQDQLALFERYGIDRRSLIHCPLFFDSQRLYGLESKKGDYFVYFGHPRMEKGGHLLKEVMLKCPDAQLVMPFNTPEMAAKAVAACELTELVESGRIVIRTGITWLTGVGKIVAESRGVLIPSIWPTTTEYVLLESIGLGKPVAAFDVGVHKDLIRSGENGLLAPLGDCDGLARNLSRLAADDLLYAKLSAGSLQLYAEMSDPDRFRNAFALALERSL